MKAVTEVAHKGPPCHTTNEEYLRLHFEIGVCFGDIEAKDMI